MEIRKREINNTLVEEKESTKYLGTFIDNKLTWKVQIQHIKSKLARGIGMMSKIRYYVDEACLLKMFYSFVHSHVNYNVLNWSCAKDSTLKPINTKLKKAIRILSFSKTMYDHTEPLFKKYNILSLKNHVTFRKSLFMWKIAHGYMQDTIRNLFTVNQYNNLKFVLPYTRNEKSKFYFVTTCIKEWNRVPDSIKILSTYSSFKLQLKNHLLGKVASDN